MHMDSEYREDVVFDRLHPFLTIGAKPSFFLPKKQSRKIKNISIGLARILSFRRDINFLNKCLLIYYVLWLSMALYNNNNIT